MTTLRLRHSVETTNPELTYVAFISRRDSCCVSCLPEPPSVDAAVAAAAMDSRLRRLRGPSSTSEPFNPTEFAWSTYRNASIRESVESTDPTAPPPNDSDSSIEDNRLVLDSGSENEEPEPEPEPGSGSEQLLSFEDDMVVVPPPSGPGSGGQRPPPSAGQVRIIRLQTHFFVHVVKYAHFCISCQVCLLQGLTSLPVEKGNYFLLNPLLWKPYFHLASFHWRGVGRSSVWMSKVPCLSGPMTEQSRRAAGRHSCHRLRLASECDECGAWGRLPLSPVSGC